jgi:diaminohydroxyphosphoribosylaminopyrimidine deaminase/5-amino-6-(5-phosphoribosylamino)uracil reductase
MVDSRDRQFMERALFLAERGRGLTSPNPIVGAVVVSPEGVVIGQGAHMRAGGPHAEVIALDAAQGLARGATLYVTLEPCSHRGRTPPCVDRIASEGVARVVYAARDPNPLVNGAGEKFLRSRGIDVTGGVLREAAERQHVPFVHWMTSRRPFITLKCVVSADGYVGGPGVRTHLSGLHADRFFHRQRAEVDAIAVGSNTLLVDDPQLTARGAYRIRPLVRVLFDWRMRVPHNARVFSTLAAGPVIMVVLRREAEHRLERQIVLEGAGVMLELREDRTLPLIARWLGGKEIVSMIVEGGPALHEAFLQAGLVDRIQVLVSPKRLGGGVRMAESLEAGGEWLKRPVTRKLGHDRLIEWDVHRTD